jgi:hypothetical protein
MRNERRILAGKSEGIKTICHVKACMGINIKIGYHAEEWIQLASIADLRAHQ